MSRRGEAGYGDDDRLPWLESVDEEYSDRPSFGRIVLLVVLVLAVIGAVAFAFYWYQKHQGLTGNGELIEAQEGDYKVKPDTPGGMQVEGEGDTVFAASEGDAPNASIAVGVEPEAPVAGQTAPAPGISTDDGAATVVLPVPKAVERLDARPAAAAGGGAAVVQLGAFPDQQGADGAWRRLSGRYDFLAALGKSVERTQRDGATVYRLRINAGSAQQARDICQRLQTAGENCYIAN